LLRPRRQRQSSGRAAKQRDELAPLHSITSSAIHEHARWNCQAQHLGSLEVDHQLLISL
jgi:hypothetical protein